MKTLAALAGIALVAAHGAGFAYLAQHSAGDELVVDLAHVTDWGAGPGLVRKHWRETYRGGFIREVGATQLVGPFQDPKHPACSGRVVIGQRLLDDGHAGEGTIAGVMKKMIDAELRGMDIFPIGTYQRIRGLSLEWARAESSPGDRRLLGKAGAPEGYVRAAATVVFDRVDVPVVVALIPERTRDSIKFRIAAEADLAFDNRVLQWVSDKVGADAIATRIAREQIDDVLVTTFAPPPPFELSDGQTLTFTYCDGPIEIADGGYGALPFAVAIHPLDHAPEILPPRFGPGERLEPRPTTALAIDLDVDALDAMLFELWRTGWLDDRLAEVGLDRRFNTDPIVTEYLSIRLSPLRLALPPVLAAAPDGSLRLAADARVSIGDGTHVTTGRVYGALDVRIAPAATPGTEIPLAVDVGALELACERTAERSGPEAGSFGSMTRGTLVPCYGDLVAAVRDRGADFHGELTEAFSSLLADIFVDRRLGAEGLPAELVIQRAVPSLGGHGTLHLELAGKLAPVQ